MGVVSDAIDALENWCCNLFKDGIKSQFDSISELLTDTFDTTTGNNTLHSLQARQEVRRQVTEYGQQ